MPARGHSSAPKFDPTKARELPSYFEELEILSRQCGITAEQDMKVQVCRYLDINSSDLWKSVTEYQGTASYADFKTAVTKYYPGATSDRKWNISDLDKLVGEYSRSGIYSIDELGVYYCRFMNIPKFLIEKNCLSNQEQSRLYL